MSRVLYIALLILMSSFGLFLLYAASTSRDYNLLMLFSGLLLLSDTVYGLVMYPSLNRMSSRQY